MPICGEWVRPAIFAALGVFTFMPIGTVAAQDAAPSPGTVQDTLREPAQPPVDLIDIPAMQFPRRAAEPVAAGGPAVRVDHIVVSGNTVLPQATIDEFAAENAGQSLTLAEIYEIADRLTDLYRARGYGVASATIPAQRVEDGTLRIAVTEGRVGVIRYDGNQRYDSDALNRQAVALSSGNVFRSADMDRAILLLNDLPGLDARAVVRAGAQPGTVDVVMQLEEDPYDIRATLDNHGRDAIGEHRFTLSGAINSLSGRGDVLSASLLKSQSNLLTYLSVAYGTPIADDGSTVTVSFSRADYDVGTAVFLPLDITGLNNNMRIDWMQPTVRSRNHNVVIGGAVSHTSAESSSLGAITTDTEITLFEVSAFVHHVWANRSASTLALGFATNLRSNADGTDQGAQAGRLRLDASHTMWFAPGWAGVLRGAAMYSPDPLADTQKFALGGPYSIRGFIASEARGDKGASATVELQRHFEFGETRAYASVFADAGTVRRHALPTDPAGLDRSTSMSSIGAGFSVSPASGWRLDAIWAKPVGSYDPQDGDTNGRVWALVSAGF